MNVVVLGEFILAIEVKGLSDLEISMSVEFDHLGSPLRVIDSSISDFNFKSLPSSDVCEDSPSSINVRIFELAIYNDIG